MNLDAFRAEFLRLLTVDSPHSDARRRDFNQAIFDLAEGWACFNGTDLQMVLDKFDGAIKSLGLCSWCGQPVRGRATFNGRRYCNGPNWPCYEMATAIGADA